MRKVKKVWSTERSVQEAVKKSQDALNIFTSTVAELTQANDELASAREKDLAQIELINKNVETANAQQRYNTTLISKINSIIS